MVADRADGCLSNNFSALARMEGHGGAGWGRWCACAASVLVAGPRSGAAASLRTLGPQRAAGLVGGENGWPSGQMIVRRPIVTKPRYLRATAEVLKHLGSQSGPPKSVRSGGGGRQR